MCRRRLKTGVACSQGPRSPWGRSVPLCFWKTVAHRYPVEEEQMHRRPRRTRRPIRNWVSVTTPLCLRNGARETREKTRKGMRGVGREIHVTSRDPTLNAVGTRSCAIRRGMSKKRATAIFDLSLRVGPPSLCVLRSLLCKFLYQASAIYIEGIVFVLFAAFCENDSSLGSPVFRTTFVLPL